MLPGVDASAHVVNCFRAKYTNISLDNFAHLWVTKPTDKPANRYLQEAGESEDIAHCLRHRFFLERLREFSIQAINGVFINIGAGFTNYPYLINTPITSCEVDKPNLIKSKQQKIQKLQSSQLLPERDILFLPITDLNKSSENKKTIRLIKPMDSLTPIILSHGRACILAFARLSQFTF